jgi:rubrerythrin
VGSVMCIRYSEEGLSELAEWFETLAKAEKSHAGRFTKGLDTLGS